MSTTSCSVIGDSEGSLPTARQSMSDARGHPGNAMAGDRAGRVLVRYTEKRARACAFGSKAVCEERKRTERIYNVCIKGYMVLTSLTATHVLLPAAVEDDPDA